MRKKELILWLINTGKTRMETHALSVNIYNQECAPFLLLNKFHVPGEFWCFVLELSCKAEYSSVVHGRVRPSKVIKFTKIAEILCFVFLLSCGSGFCWIAGLRGLRTGWLNSSIKQIRPFLHQNNSLPKNIQHSQGKAVSCQGALEGVWHNL